MSYSGLVLDLGKRMDGLAEVTEPVTTAIQIINGMGIAGYLMRNLKVIDSKTQE